MNTLIQLIEPACPLNDRLIEPLLASKQRTILSPQPVKTKIF